jgi:hypothetical protein
VSPKASMKIVRATWSRRPGRSDVVRNPLRAGGDRKEGRRPGAPQREHRERVALRLHVDQRVPGGVEVVMDQLTQRAVVAPCAARRRRRIALRDGAVEQRLDHAADERRSETVRAPGGARRLGNAGLGLSDDRGGRGRASGAGHLRLLARARGRERAAPARDAPPPPRRVDLAPEVSQVRRDATALAAGGRPGPDLSEGGVDSGRAAGGDLGVEGIRLRLDARRGRQRWARHDARPGACSIRDRHGFLLGRWDDAALVALRRLGTRAHPRTGIGTDWDE